MCAPKSTVGNRTLFAQRFQHLWKTPRSLLGWVESAVVKQRQRYHRRRPRDKMRKTHGAASRPAGLTRVSADSYTISFVRRREHSHEAYIPAQQSQAQEDPWVPRADAKQGRPSRPQASSPEGTEADRGLSARDAGSSRSAARVAGALEVSGAVPPRSARGPAAGRRVVPPVRLGERPGPRPPGSGRGAQAGRSRRAQSRQASAPGELSAQQARCRSRGLGSRARAEA